MLPAELLLLSADSGSAAVGAGRACWSCLLGLTCGLVGSGPSARLLERARADLELSYCARRVAAVVYQIMLSKYSSTCRK
eukprot:SAG31_NODE_6784_length_1889_cov_70.125698_2_plen_80_part_00